MMEGTIKEQKEGMDIDPIPKLLKDSMKTPPSITRAPNAHRCAGFQDTCLENPGTGESADQRGSQS